jgi:hypothetical protein
MAFFRLRFVFMVGCLLAGVCGGELWAQMGVPLNRSDPALEPATVRELVARYCRMDYSGARLNPNDWPKLQPLVTWHENPDFTLFMVTSRFDVSAELDSEHGKYGVTVHYRLLGKYDLAEGYSQESANQVQNVRFTVAEVNGEWRITDADPNFPHVSKTVAVQWVKQKLAATSDPVAKTLYENALQRLQGPTAPAPAQ